MTDHAETTLPVLTFTATGIEGDAPALGRLVIDEDQGADQAWLAWGLRSRTYSADVDCALYYDALLRTVQGAGATSSTAPSGYSGSGCIVAPNLSTSLESILSTQDSVTPYSHHQHTGAYRLFARWQAKTSNSGTVAVAFEWSTGDFRRSTRNATTYLTDTRASDGAPVQGYWLLVDHGIVRIPPSSTQWQGRFLACSTVQNDDVYVDHYFLVPIDEGYGEATAAATSSAPSSFTARDDFGSSGALTGASLTTGGTWTLVSAGGSPSHPDSDDFSLSSGYAQRTAASDNSTGAQMGRWVYASTPTAMSDVQVYAGIKYDAIHSAGVNFGVVARAVDRDNFLTAVVSAEAGGVYIKVYKVVSNTATLLLRGQAPGATTSDTNEYPLYLTVTAGGAWSCEFGANRVLVGSGYDAVLATGAALASGKVGVIDWNTSASTTPRKISWFYAWAPTPDAACFASQSAQIAHNGVTREDTTGPFFAPMSSYIGDYLLIPPSGAESRTTEVIVKACRQNPRTGVDNNIDDISAKLYVTPRGLVV